MAGTGGKREGAGRKPGSPNKLTVAQRRTLAEIAGEYTEKAIQTLAQIMEDKKAPHAARATAANSLLDRAHGKPKQPIEHELDLSNLTDEQLGVLAVALGAAPITGERAAGDRAPPTTH